MADQLRAFDEAVAAELPFVSTLEYSARAMCAHFAKKLRDRLASPPVAVQEERDASEKLLKDLRWRLDDIRDMLMKEGHNGDRIYGCDEWSTPTVNLATAITVIDKALSAMKGDQP